MDHPEGAGETGDVRSKGLRQEFVTHFLRPHLLCSRTSFPRATLKTKHGWASVCLTLPLIGKDRHGFTCTSKDSGMQRHYYPYPL